MKTLESIREEKKLSAGKSVVTKKTMVFSKNPETACIIPVGTYLKVHFSGLNNAFIYFEYNGALRTSLTRSAYHYFSGFIKEPSLKALDSWERNGFCKSITGGKTEPDGFTPDGAPSWLLALGII